MEWISVGYGLQYRKHQSRKHGVRFDRYFRGRYTVSGKTITVGFGWESEGWNQDKCHKELNSLKEAAKTGAGPQTLKEKQQIEGERRELEQLEQEQKARDEITFGEFFEESYLPVAEAAKKKKTVQAEVGYYNNWIKPVLGETPFRDIFPLHFERIKKNMLDAKKAPRSVQYCLAIGRQIWNLARRDGLIDRESPTIQVKKPKFDNKRVRFLTHYEANRLLGNLSGRSKQLHDMALLSLHTGMRAGEIFALKWGNVDLERGLINIFDAKGGSRTGYMTSKVMEMLKGIDKGQPDELVFKDRKGGQIKEASNAFQRAVDDIGLNNGVTDHRQKVLFHSLRHTYASWLVQQGEPLYTVQRLMGHASISMTERYSHLAPDTFKRSVDNFEQNIQALEDKRREEASAEDKTDQVVNMENHKR